MKTIPPYKPIPADNGSSDSSPEKEADSMVKAGVSSKRKSTSKTTTTTTSSAVGSKIVPTVGKTVVGGHSPSVGDGAVAIPGGDLADATKSSSPAPNVASAASNVSGSTKFTTSNFVETVVTQSESVFGADVPTSGQSVRMSMAGMPTTASTTVTASNMSGKKRKAGNRTPTNPDTASDVNSIQVPVSVMSGATGLPVTAASGSISVGSANLTITSSGTPDSHTLLVGDSKKLKVETSNPIPSTTMTDSVVVRPMVGNVITSAPSSASVPSGSIVVSVPLAATSIQPPISATNTVVTSAPTLFQQLQQSIVVANNAAAAAAANAAAVTASQAQQLPQPSLQQPQMDDQPGKRAR